MSTGNAPECEAASAGTNQATVEAPRFLEATSTSQLTPQLLLFLLR